MRLIPGIVNPDKTEYRLPIPYFNQNDNDVWDGAGGNVQCCPTNNALFAFYHSPKFRDAFMASRSDEPETYYKEAFEAAGYSASDRGSHDCHTEVLREWGIQSRWATNGADAEIIKALDTGSSLVCGLNYKQAGHIAQIVGYYGTDIGTANRKIAGYLIHDCYGLRDGAANSYGYINPREGEVRGAYDRYSYDLLQLLLFDTPKSGAWVRFFKQSQEQA